MPSESKKEPLRVQPPDGGWGWMVVGSVFFINTLSLGAVFSIGVIFDLLMKDLGCSRFEVSAMASLAFSLQCLLAPAVGALHDYCGARKVVFFGSLAVSFALIISAFAPNMLFLYPFFGVLAGMGIAMVCLPTLVMISHYFDKKLSLATAFGVIGVFLGCFLHPHLMRFLISIYGWRGALLISGALSLNSVPASLVLRPPDYGQPDSDGMSSTSTSEEKDSEEESIDMAESVPEKEELPPRLDNSETRLESLVSENLLRQALMHPYRKRNEETQMTTPLPSDEDLSQSFRSVGRLAGFPNHHYAAWKAKPLLTSSHHTILKGISSPRPVAKFRRFVSVPDPSDRFQFGTPLAESYHKGAGSSTSVSPLEHVAENYSRYFLPSLFATPTQQSIADLPLVISQMKAREQPETDDGPVVPEAPSRCKFERFGIFALHAELLVNPELMIFVLANLLICMTLWVPSVYIVDWGSTLGIEQQLTTTLLSFVGVGNIVGRPIVALVADKLSKHRPVIFFVLVAVSGALSVTLPLFANLYTLAAFVFQFAFLIGGTQTLLTPVIADLIPLSQMAPAFGILLAAEGAGILAGPPLLGLLPMYEMTFSATGFVLLVAAGIMFFGMIIRPMRKMESLDYNVDQV